MLKATWGLGSNPSHLESYLTPSFFSKASHVLSTQDSQVLISNYFLTHFARQAPFPSVIFSFFFSSGLAGSPCSSSCAEIHPALHSPGLLLDVGFFALTLIFPGRSSLRLSFPVFYPCCLFFALNADFSWPRVCQLFLSSCCRSVIMSLGHHLCRWVTICVASLWAGRW